MQEDENRKMILKNHLKGNKQNLHEYSLGETLGYEDVRILYANTLS